MDQELQAMPEQKRTETLRRQIFPEHHKSDARGEMEQQGLWEQMLGFDSFGQLSNKLVPLFVHLERCGDVNESISSVGKLSQ